MSRGGGADGADMLNSYSGAFTCEGFCNYFEGGALTDSCCPATSVIYYAKCYNSSSAIPLNGVRFAFASQIGTIDLDPALARMNTPNKTTCRRVF